MPNQLGNVLATVSGLKIGVDINSDNTADYYTTIVLSGKDYYPFGMTMPGRNFGVGYRFGFNGKERDVEGMGGGGSTYDYGFRIYNPSLGKFLSVDPLSQSYPWYTPYQFAGNKPIVAIDIDGLEEYIVIHYLDDFGVPIPEKTEIIVVRNGDVAAQLAQKLWGVLSLGLEDKNHWGNGFKEYKDGSYRAPNHKENGGHSSSTQRPMKGTLVVDIQLTAYKNL